MKRFLLSLLLLLPFVVSAQSLRGDWSGKLSLPMGKLRIVIHPPKRRGAGRLPWIAQTKVPMGYVPMRCMSRVIACVWSFAAYV